KLSNGSSTEKANRPTLPPSNAVPRNRLGMSLFLKQQYKEHEAVKLTSLTCCCDVGHWSNLPHQEATPGPSLLLFSARGISIPTPVFRLRLH
ncbi:hypothetical protein WA026_000905, partial [Henosepilachna vigintioctopunctata]